MASFDNLLHKSFFIKISEKIQIAVADNPCLCVSSPETGIAEPFWQILPMIRGGSARYHNKWIGSAVLAAALMLPTTALAQEDKICALAIREDSLVDALSALADQCDMQAIYPLNLVNERKRYHLYGQYPVLDALDRLLQGSSLSANLTPSGYITVSRAIKTQRRDEMGKEKRGLKAFVAGILGGAMASAGSMGYAQSPSSAPTSIEEVIVTATKRAQSIQDVPITMTALTGDSLERLGIGSMESLALGSPGLHFGRQGGGSAVILLRGVGTANGSAGNEPSVATYVDGVYMPNSNASLGSFNDIDRVEVLKGPQGTLFGRNATGGLVHIITKDPTQETEAKLKIGYGNYETFESGFYGSTGITENTAANISVYFKDQGRSPLSNPVPGVDFVPDSDISVRGKWIYTPTDELEVKFTGYYQDYESSIGTARQPKPGVLAQSGQGYTGKYFSIANEVPSYYEIESKGANAQLRYSFPSVDLISVSSWSKDQQHNAFDNDGTAAFLMNSYGNIGAETYTQELRVVSTYDSKLEWIAGLYYFDNEASYDPLLVELASGMELRNYAVQDMKSWAVFGEGSYALTEKTSLVLGLRWNRDDLDYSGQSFSSVGPIFAHTELSDSFEEATYRLGINHQLNADMMLYATYSRGYKSGLFNLVNLGAPPEPAIAPEILDAYEIGFKSDGWFNGQLRFNGAAFYYDYQDLQVVTIGTVALASASAAAATIKGVELDMNAQVADGLNISLGVAYLDTEYDSYVGSTNRPAPNGLGNVVVSPVDFSGNELVRAPELTFSFALSYIVPTSVGEFDFSTLFYHNGGFYWDDDNRIKEGAHSILNLDVGWTLPSDKTKISLWGRNVLEEEYSAFTNNSPVSGDSYMPTEPRMYGVRVEYSF